jgi:hypothetical protein
LLATASVLKYKYTLTKFQAIQFKSKNMPKKTKQIIPAKKALETDKDYQNLLDELKSIIAKGQFQAYKAVDNIKVQTY